MNNVYRVVMQDQVNGQTFTFSMRYTTAGKDSAVHLARLDYGQDVIVTRVERV